VWRTFLELWFEMFEEGPAEARKVLCRAVGCPERVSIGSEIGALPVG